MKVYRHNLHDRFAVSVKKDDVTIKRFLAILKARFASCHKKFNFFINTNKFHALNFYYLDRPQKFFNRIFTDLQYTTKELKNKAILTILHACIAMWFLVTL